jgi:cardiolipin synthase A/B
MLLGFAAGHKAMHEITLVETMAELVDHLFSRIDRARERAWIEVYILRDGRFADELECRLAAAARRGVDARILYDGLGSHKLRRGFVDRCRAHGVQTRVYRPLVRSVLEGKIFPRDHGRIFIVDGCGYTTGAAFADEWLPRRRGGEGWHDASAAIEGPCVDELARMFELRWSEERRAPHRLSRACQHGDVEILADAPADGLEILDRYIDRIRTARSRVWIENAYFFPPRIFVDVLAEAAERGVDVRVIVPRKTDLRAVRWAASAEYEEWLARGIRLFEFLPRVLHSKAAVIDDDWATVGSLNVDVASLRWGNEVNLVVKDDRFVQQTAALLEHDFAASEELRPGVQRNRSWAWRALCATARKALRIYEKRWLHLLDAPDGRSLAIAASSMRRLPS